MNDPIVVTIDGNPLDEKQTVVHLVGQLIERATKKSVLSSTVLVRLGQDQELALRITLLPERKKAAR